MRHRHAKHDFAPSGAVVGEPAQRTASQHSHYRDLRHLKAKRWMIRLMHKGCSGTINQA